MSNCFYVAQCPILSDFLSSDQQTLELRRWVGYITTLDLILGTMKLDVSMLLILLCMYWLLTNYALAVISCRCCEVPEIILASQNYNWFLLGHRKRYWCVFYHLVLGKLFLIALIIYILAFRNRHVGKEDKIHILLYRWKNQRHIEKDPVQGRNGTVGALEVLGRGPMVVVPAVHLVVWTMFEGLITVSWMLIFEPLFSVLSIDLFTDMWYDVVAIRLVTCLWLVLWLRYGCFHGSST